MADIVERLRIMSPQLDPLQCEDVEQAADEIERLRAALAQRSSAETERLYSEQQVGAVVEKVISDMLARGELIRPGDLPQRTPKPIETAPKNGTHILAWRIPVGIRFTNNTNPPTVVHWFNDPDEPGFYTSVNEMAPEHPFNPTHWMPLPAGPSLTRTKPQTAREPDEEAKLVEDIGEEGSE